MQQLRRAIAVVLSFILAGPVAQYIRWNRDRLWPQAQPLSRQRQEAFAAYFPAPLLEAVRIVERDPLPLAELPLAGMVRRLGFDFPGLGSVSAITLGRLIAARGPMDDALLFHEMVHVAQFERLGIGRFSRYYVRGFLESGSYLDIPLERCAYELEGRFCSQREPFVVLEAFPAWPELKD